MGRINYAYDYVTGKGLRLERSGSRIDFVVQKIGGDRWSRTARLLVNENGTKRSLDLKDSSRYHLSEEVDVKIATGKRAGSNRVSIICFFDERYKTSLLG